MDSTDGEYPAAFCEAAAEQGYDAALRYIRARYGNLVDAPGRYASGGIIPRPGGGNGGNRPQPPAPRHGGTGSTNTIHFTGGGGSLSGAGGAAGSGGSGTVSGGGGGGSSFSWHSSPEPEPEPALVPGSVTGYRWWTLPAPDWLSDPGDAERNWPHALLHGVQDCWRPGVNTACCRGGYSYSGRSQDHPVPVKGCGCGYWAYWQPEHRSMGGGGTVPVFGVVKAWGRTRRASRGFRAEKARILAVHLPFTLQPEIRDPGRPDWGSVLPPGWHDVNQLARPQPFPEQASPDARHAADDHAEAWMAVIGDRLETGYGVRVFETRDALLACFPPDPEGLRRMSALHCPRCGGNPALGLEGHDLRCPAVGRW